MGNPPKTLNLGKDDNINSLFFIFLAKGFIVGILALSVKLQIVLLRGFDLTLAVGTLLGAELFVYSVNSQLGFFPALVIGLVAPIIYLSIWNIFAFQTFSPSGDKNYNNNGVFLFSLGISMSAMGLGGLIRGPGLRLIEPSDLPTSLIEWGSLSLILIVGAGVAVTAFFLLKTQEGFKLNLVEQNREFAQEIGIEAKSLCIGVGILSGLLSGAAGVSLALLGGTSLSIGMIGFLFGAGGALLFDAKIIWHAFYGGLLVGFLWVGFEYFGSPSLAQPLVYTIVIVVIMSKAYQGLWGKPKWALRFL